MANAGEGAPGRPAPMGRPDEVPTLPTHIVEGTVVPGPRTAAGEQADEDEAMIQAVRNQPFLKKECSMCVIFRNFKVYYLRVYGIDLVDETDVWRDASSHPIQVDIVQPPPKYKKKKGAARFRKKKGPGQAQPPKLRIRYLGSDVDVIHTCDGCRAKVSATLAGQSAVEPQHHLIGKERFDVQTELRDRDRLRAIWVRLDQTVRLARNAAEAAEKAEHEAHTEAFKQAVAEKAQHEREVAEAEDDLREAEMKHTVQNAVQVDGRWQEWELSNLAREARVKELNMSLQREDIYGTEHRPASPRRRDKHSYSPREYDDNGVPRTERAAAETFGTWKFEREDHLPDLVRWKEEATKIGEIQGLRQQLREANARALAVQAAEELKAEWQRIANGIEARKLKRELQEERRRELELQARRREKQRRAILRDQTREEAERRRMAVEDDRVRLVLAFEAEQIAEAAERVAMQEQEKEQTSVDLFWGIPTYEAAIAAVRNKEEDEFYDRVMVKYRSMVRVGLIKRSGLVEQREGGEEEEGVLAEDLEAATARETAMFDDLLGLPPS